MIAGGFCNADGGFVGTNFLVGAGSGLEGGVGDRIRCLCTSPRKTEPICVDMFFGGRLEDELAFSGLVTLSRLSPSAHSFSPTTAASGACSVEMQPSQFEIQREVENLRDIRRRSTAGGPGTLVLDPDLPNQSVLGAAQLNYWDPSQSASGSSSSTEDSGSSADDHDDDGSDGGDPSSLFWVPARLHPEIDPAEFRAFIKEHARTPADGSTSLDRSFSISSGGFGRKKSMLNREYKPTVNDGVENEGQVFPLRRNRSSYYNVGPQLSISDLQKLDELAEEASQSDDPSKLRSVLRRSLSMNMSPSGVCSSPHRPQYSFCAPLLTPSDSNSAMSHSD